jgi:hypothetical protein
MTIEATSIVKFLMVDFFYQLLFSSIHGSESTAAGANETTNNNSHTSLKWYVWRREKEVCPSSP